MSHPRTPGSSPGNQEVGRVTAHLQSNVVGYVALFFVFTGGAYALEGKNTVDSGDIKKGQVRKSDLRKAAVTGPKLAPNAVDGSKVAPDSITGDDVDEATLKGLGGGGGGATGTAGGDLTGSYPNPDIAAGAVGASEIADGAIGAAKVASQSLGTGQIDESTLFNDNSLDAADVANTSPLGTAEINESTLFNDDSLDAGDVANTSPLGTAEINEVNLFNDNSLSAVDIANNAIGSAEPGVSEDEIADGTVDGEDVLESSLGTVPAATSATSATSAANATALDTFVSGRIFTDSAPVGVGFATTLNDFGGLTLRTDCTAGPNLVANATTSVSNSSIHVTAISTAGGVSAPLEDRDFDTTETHPLGLNGDGIGTIVYRQSTGSFNGQNAVTANFSFAESGTNCEIEGVAIGRD